MRKIVDVPPIMPCIKQRIAKTAHTKAIIYITVQEPRIIEKNAMMNPLVVMLYMVSQNHRKDKDFVVGVGCRKKYLQKHHYTL